MVSKELLETDRYGAGVDPAKPRHTPGPWESVASDPSEGFECYWIRAAKPYGGPFRGSRVVEIGAVNGPQNSEQSANARLIAAAPDLLAALEDLVGICRMGAEKTPARKKYDAALAAIAKATTPEPSHD